MTIIIIGRITVVAAFASVRARCLHYDIWLRMAFGAFSLSSAVVLQFNLRFIVCDIVERVWILLRERASKSMGLMSYKFFRSKI